jgi:hypothetical protein
MRDRIYYTCGGEWRGAKPIGYKSGWRGDGRPKEEGIGGARARTRVGR